MTTLRIGLAGLGVHGGRYARHLLAGDVPGARLAAVSRKDAAAGRRFAAEHGVAFVERPEDLATLADVDAVIVCLPPAFHGDVATACAEAGRPTLVEKPLAATVAAARRVAAAAARTGAPLMPAHTLRFDPLVERIVGERDSIGDLCALTLNQRFEPSDRSWIDIPGCGGMLLNTGVHEFDLVRHLSGREPVAVTACATRVRTIHTEDQFAATIDLGDGVIASLDASRASDSRSGRIELIGTAGQVWGDHVHRTLCRVRGRHLEDCPPVPHTATLPRTLAAFVRCVVADSQLPVGVDDGVAAVAMVEAALRAAADGRRVPLAEI